MRRRRRHSLFFLIFLQDVDREARNLIICLLASIDRSIDWKLLGGLRAQVCCRIVQLSSIGKHELPARASLTSRSIYPGREREGKPIDRSISDFSSHFFNDSA